MGFKNSQGDQPLASRSGIPAMYDTGDLDTAPSNETKITASDGASSDRFGGSVAVGSGRIVVGAYDDDDNGGSSGSAYIYETPNVITPYDLQDQEKG